ncbi:MAG: metallophosphoesterase [Armatimonadetes bacterium]|nr:metallophosphoesterase [Armatimonadota bacterium]
MGKHVRQTLGMVLLLGLVLLARPARAEDTFTLAIVPDVQPEVATPQFQARLQWLVDNRAKLNLKAVLQVGDLMNFNDEVQYKHQSEALKVLDNAKLPYAMCLGNHDTAAVKFDGGSAAPGNVNQNLRNTARYNQYFPLSRFAMARDTFEALKIDNSVHLFEAGGLKWCIINLELWARTDVIDWAKRMVEKYADRNVIFLTHAHLNGDLTIQQNNGGYGNNSPQLIFDQAMKPYANVQMVFCGHAGVQGYRTDKAADGHPIHSFLQCYHDNTTNPTRLLEIDTKNGTMKSRVYCQTLDTDKADGSTMTVTGVAWVKPKG